MTAATRGLYPAYFSILTRLADQGELPCASLGTDARTDRRLQHLLALGYISARRDPGAPRRRFLYAISDAGRTALGRGVGVANPRFTATEPPPRAPIVRVGCVHHWKIGSDLAQTGWCQNCHEVREFAPRFGELAVVGGGKVTASERFAARVAG